MRYMIIIKATEASEAGRLPSTELLTAMGAFNESLFEAGVLVTAEGLQPSSKGARVTVSRDRQVVVDGPFAEAKELVGGFWIVDVPSLDEAVAGARRVPAPPSGSMELEVRKVSSPDDFGEPFTEDLREAEDDLRAKLTP